MSPIARALHLLLATACAAPTLAADSLSPLPDAEWTREAAAHLLRRAAFGGTPAEIDKLYSRGVDWAVDSLIDYGPTRYDPGPPGLDPLVLEPRIGEDGVPLEDRDPEAIRKRQEAERRSHLETRLWWIERIVESPRPLEEKMTLFWHGHFTSGAREVKRALFMYEQNEFLRKNAMGGLRELLVGISRDRAMLIYLDNFRNRKKQPNENYARELLELFSLGEGNYSEADIKAAARAFTGWSMDREGYRFYRAAHDDGEKTFMGHSGPLDGEDIIDTLLQQPACARLIARKLLIGFVTPEPEPRLVEALATELRRNGYLIRPTMRTLLKSRAFYAPENRGALIKSPVDLLAGTARQLGIKINALRGAERALAELGQELMQPPNVKGWPGGTHWINTAMLLQRYNFVGDLIHGRGGKQAVAMTEPPQANDDATEDTDGRARASQAGQGPLDPWPLLGEPRPTAANEVVDRLAGRLLAVPLSADKRETLVDYLNGKDGFDPSAKNVDERLRKVIHLICSTPEYQLQ